MKKNVPFLWVPCGFVPQTFDPKVEFHIQFDDEDLQTLNRETEKILKQLLQKRLVCKLLLKKMIPFGQKVGQNCRTKENE